MKPRRFKPRGGKREETGAIVKQDKSLIKAALVYPNTYQAGMSSLGFQTVYRLINALDTVACQRVFLPEKARTPAQARSEEAGLTLDQFDIILFSISFENDVIHLVHLLREAGIPSRSSDRNTIHPLVIAGGVACFLNPEPIADLIDCFLLGEAEMLIKPFFDLYTALPSRQHLLAQIESRLEGAYVPARHTPVLWKPAPAVSPTATPHRPSESAQSPIRVRHVPDLSTISTATQVVTRDTAFKQSILIETGRGCPHGCRFCSAGYIYRPPRMYPASTITKAMDQAKDLTSKVGLVSSAVSNHPDINQICTYGIEQDLNLSFSSLRADALTDELIKSVAGSSVKTATIAPEAGSQHMRDIINKKLDQESILSCVDRFVSAGIPNLRLYFMVGLPHETLEDVDAIADLTLEIKERFLESARKMKRIGTITLSINPFIPKPATPFQWAAMRDPKDLKKRLDRIKTRLKAVSNVKIITESLKQARINALLSRGDRNASYLIEAAAKDASWTRTLKTHAQYVHTVIHTDHHEDTPLPWAFIDNGLDPSFLSRENQNAAKAKITPACPMIDCQTCQMCMA